jgi:YegS/Rv2252/BmrU family lipid kinase
MSHVVALVNPQSQHGALGRKWPDVARVLRREIGAFETVFTQGPGDAPRLVREALRAGCERLVAVGGDGTINEVVNGFFEDGAPVAPESALCIVPFGTGGDFRRTIGLPKSWSEAARALASGKTRPIDLGLLEHRGHDGSEQTRLFANIASFGISGVVDRLVNESSKRLGGKLSFMLGSLRATWRYTNQRVRITFDGDARDAVDMTINTVAVANGRYFGGGMCVAPDAEVDDGFFDVVAIGDLSRSQMIFSSPRIYRGTHLSMDKVSHRRARTLRAEPIGSDPVELDVDGETPGILPASFRVLPRALNLVVPG